MFGARREYQNIGGRIASARVERRLGPRARRRRRRSAQRARERSQSFRVIRRHRGVATAAAATVALPDRR